MKIAIILPAYNEELTLRATILEYAAAFPEGALIVIDNNSKDGTSDVAREALSGLSQPNGLLFEARKGKANAIRKAFQSVDADYYIMADADLTYPAADAQNLLKVAIEKQLDMVVGDRISNGRYQAENKRPFHNLGNLMVRFFICRLFNSSIRDVLSGLRVFSRRFVDSFPVTIGGFELETELTLFALEHNQGIAEVPIEYRDRPEGSFSKLNTYFDGLRVLKTIFFIFQYHRPIIFWGFAALFSFMLSLACGIPVLYEFVQYKYVYRVPSAILATGLAILAVVFLNVGIILSAVLHFQRQNVQLAMNRTKKFCINSI